MKQQNQILKPTFLIITISFLYWLSVQFIAALITISVLILLGIIVNKTFNTQLINQAVSYFCESFLVILISPLLIITQIKNLFMFLQKEFDLSPLKFVLVISITSAFLFAPIILSETLNALLWYSLIALFSLLISINSDNHHFETSSNNGFFLGFVLIVSLVIFGLIPNFITIASLTIFNIGALIININVSKSFLGLISYVNNYINSENVQQQNTDAGLTYVLQQANAIIYKDNISCST